MGKVLVIGGGITGIQAALDLADMGHQVHLIEKEKELGGNLKKIYKLFPTNEPAEKFLTEVMDKAKRHRNIAILTGSTPSEFDEENNTYKVTIDAKGKQDRLEVDAIVLATGFVPFNPVGVTEYGYQRYKDVITSVELEGMMKNGYLTKPSDSQESKAVTFIQCIGSRDVRTHEYCSSFCCTLTMKNALLIKSAYPDTEVTVMYMDIRTPYIYENLYSEARNAGVKFIRARPADVYELNRQLVINFEDTLASQSSSIKSDLVVLAVGGISPSETSKLSKTLKLSLSETGFFKVHNGLGATNAKRIFVVGGASGPKDIDHSLSQAGAAASQINKLLS